MQEARAATAPHHTLQNSISRTGRDDCKHAYAGMGLLAAPRLLWDTMRDKGCKW